MDEKVGRMAREWERTAGGRGKGQNGVEKKGREEGRESRVAVIQGNSRTLDLVAHVCRYACT